MAGAADNKQRAFMSALMYSFLHKTLVEKTLPAQLAERKPMDGGMRNFANVVHKAKGVVLAVKELSEKGKLKLPKWLAPRRLLGACGA